MEKQGEMHNSEEVRESPDESRGSEPPLVEREAQGSNTELYAALELASFSKIKIEKTYEILAKDFSDRQNRLVVGDRKVQFEALLLKSSWSSHKNSQVIGNFSQKECDYLKLKRMKLEVEDFIIIKTLGKGAFGEVKLVRKIDNGKIYAMKIIKKSEMVKSDQFAHIKAERDFLAESSSPWFLPGGDMMSLLIKLDIFPEFMVKFYIAECILAIESVHKLGFIHRDIKPDNILIDAQGHIKLTDFGLSTGFHRTHVSSYYEKLFNLDSSEQDTSSKSSLKPPLPPSNNSEASAALKKKNKRILAYSTVGTPDYISPEVLQNKGYGQESDWWSLGAIMFEMVFGYPPFWAESHLETYQKIIHWKSTLVFPQDKGASKEALDLMRGLLSESEVRLGRNGSHSIKAHPYFSGIDWHKLKETQAPFVPQLNSSFDTRYFTVEEESTCQELQSNNCSPVNNSKKDLAFIGYTFKRFGNTIINKK